MTRGMTIASGSFSRGIVAAKRKPAPTKLRCISPGNIPSGGEADDSTGRHAAGRQESPENPRATLSRKNYSAHLSGVKNGELARSRTLQLATSRPDAELLTRSIRRAFDMFRAGGPRSRLSPTKKAARNGKARRASGSGSMRKVHSISTSKGSRARTKPAASYG